MILNVFFLFSDINSNQSYQDKILIEKLPILFIGNKVI